MIIKNSKEEINFTSDTINCFKEIDIIHLMSKVLLENTVQVLAKKQDYLWHKYLKKVNIVRWSKNWWNKECQSSLVNYGSSKHLSNWKIFRNMVKCTKQIFFNDKIQEIIISNQNPWDLMNWVQKCKLPTIEAIQYIVLNLTIYGKLYTFLLTLHIIARLTSIYWMRFP